MKSSNPIRKLDFCLEIFSDASNTGWGAVCNGQVSYGSWSEIELKQHINYLELLAAYFGLQCYASDMRDREILLRVDNTTAVSYINRMGGIQYPNLNDISKTIWLFCEERNIWIFASYIVSKDNVDADKASRVKNVDTEWELADWAYGKVVKTLGLAEIDLFASRINKKCALFCSWHREPGAYCTDAFTINWENLKFYAFPPFALILKTLRKIISDQAQGIVVVPDWPSQPWFPLWKSLLITTPIYFNPNNNLLTCNFRQTRHPLAAELSLMAGTLSGKVSEN